MSAADRLRALTEAAQNAPHLVHVTEAGGYTDYQFSDGTSYAFPDGENHVLPNAPQVQLARALVNAAPALVALLTFDSSDDAARCVWHGQIKRDYALDKGCKFW